MKKQIKPKHLAFHKRELTSPKQDKPTVCIKKQLNLSLRKLSWPTKPFEPSKPSKALYPKTPDSIICSLFKIILNLNKKIKSLKL